MSQRNLNNKSLTKDDQQKRDDVLANEITELQEQLREKDYQIEALGGDQNKNRLAFDRGSQENERLKQMLEVEQQSVQQLDHEKSQLHSQIADLKNKVQLEMNNSQIARGEGDELRNELMM